MEKVRCTLFLQTLQIIVVLFSSYTIVDAQQWSTPLNLRELNSSADDFAPSLNFTDSLLIFNSTRKGKSRYYKTQKAKLRFLFYIFKEQLLRSFKVQKD